MVIHGRVENGVIVPEGPISLPDGTEVTIVVRAGATVHSPPVQRPVVLPIFDYDGPPDIDLTNERIAEILDRDDASA